ncbi:MAG: tetratricopeptide repeat protein, partial [Nitrospinaceae bacterium]|nr:tetratricopeptide repeat protein [Nitrospinaceae bacterium]
MTNNLSTRTQSLLATLALFVLTLISYANTLLSPFNFDDQALLQHIILNNANGFDQIWPLRYRHLLYFSFSFNHSLSGLEPYSYHLTNLLLHFLTSVVIFLITFKTCVKTNALENKSALGFAVITTFLFALNPVHTEAITYISGRASSMGGFFFMLALLFFILGSERKANSSVLLPLYYTLSLSAFSLALLSKETTLSFPFVIILYDLCFMRNANWHSIKSRVFFIYLPLFILVGGFILFSPTLRSVMLDWLGRVDGSYALAQPQIWAYAVKLCLFPINLNFDYDFPDHWIPQDFFSFIPVIVGLALILTVLTNFRKIHPLLSFSILWFLITLSPTNSFLPRTDLLSERNLYLPSLGPTLILSYLLHQTFFLSLKNSQSRKGVVLLVILFMLMSSLLITRNSIYRTNIHLWQDTYKKSPADLKVLHNLSHFYLEEKRYQQALVPLLKLSRSEAGDFYRAFAYSNLGSIYTQNGNFDRAKKEFHKAIELEPTLPLGYLNLGTYYASRGNFVQARTEFLRARERYIKYTWGYPMPAELDLNLAKVTWQLNDLPTAEKHIHQFLKKVPSSSDGLLLLGKIYQSEG